MSAQGPPGAGGFDLPALGEKASHYSAVCLEPGETEHMELTGTSASVTSAAFLRQLRVDHAGLCVVIWDHGPTHGGEVGLRLIRLPAYSPDCNPDEAIWAWAREGATANTWLGTSAAVQEWMQQFFADLAGRTAEVQSRCRRSRIRRGPHGNPIGASA